jgi:hypothetical protein
MENDLTYREYPVKILDTSERVTMSKIIRMCKVQWSHHTDEKATWEREDELRKTFLSCSLNLLNLRTRFSLRG